jgi:excisionase family DNA binding protein
VTDDTLPRTQYLKVSEIAEDLRVAPMTVYRMIHAGTLRAYRLGRRTYRVPADDYARYKRELETEATDRTASDRAPGPGQLEILPAATDGLAAL